MNSIARDAMQYDLPSLKKLQEKRRENIGLFEQSIKNERGASQQEEVVEAALEAKLHRHNSGQNKLNNSEKELILIDLPKLKITRDNRNKTISLLKEAILAECDMMDKEEKMIHYLEKNNGSKN